MAGLLLRGVGGSRSAVVMPFALGTVDAGVVMPFSLDPSDVAKSVVTPFLLNGPADGTVVMPFDLDGDIAASVETPFSILDATTGTSGGFIIAPLIGWRDEA